MFLPGGAARARPEGTAGVYSDITDAGLKPVTHGKFPMTKSSDREDCGAKGVNNQLLQRNQNANVS